MGTTTHRPNQTAGFHIKPFVSALLSKDYETRRGHSRTLAQATVPAATASAVKPPVNEADRLRVLDPRRLRNERSCWMAKPFRS